MRKHTTKNDVFLNFDAWGKIQKSISLGTTDENGENKNTLKTKGAATIVLKSN